MKLKTIVLLLIPLNLILGYFVYNSINSEIDFQKDAKLRIAENVQKLKDLRAIQIAYKLKNQVYASNFENLFQFLNQEKMAVIKSTGEAPDSLTEQQALALGLIQRDSVWISAMDYVFTEEYQNTRDNRFPLDIKVLQYIPHTNNLPYEMEAGTIEKGKAQVQVFQISATYANVFFGLDAENKEYDLNSILSVGSMTEVSLNGNWGE